MCENLIFTRSAKQPPCRPVFNIFRSTFIHYAKALSFAFCIALITDIRILAIRIPIQPITNRVFGDEASNRRVVIPCTEVDEAGFFVVVFAAVVEGVAEVRDVEDAVPYKGYRKHPTVSPRLKRSGMERSHEISRLRSK